MDQAVPSQFMEQKDDRKLETGFSTVSKEVLLPHSAGCEGNGWECGNVREIHDLNS